MEGRREHVEISASIFSCAVSPPCEVDNLSQICGQPSKVGFALTLLNTSCVGLPSDTKYLSEATFVEFLQGLQMTSISNPRLALID